MRGIFSYLKIFENKISDTNENLLDLHQFKHPDFDINAYIKNIISKVNETDYLISSLKKMKENLSDDIVKQINSNFNNYLVLISKMQAIDFLVDNIEKPLKSIKHYINEQYSYLEKFEKEVNSIKSFFLKNESEILNIKITLKFHKQLEIMKSIGNSILNKYEVKIGSLAEQNYEIKREVLNDIIRYLSKYRMCTNYLLKIENNDDLSGILEFSSQKFLFLNHIEEFFRAYLKHTDKSNSDSIIYLCLRIFEISETQEKFYQILNEYSNISLEIENIWKKQKLSMKLSKFLNEVNNLYTSKFSQILSIIKNNSLNFQIEENILLPVVFKLLIEEKDIFNCIEPSTFKDNFHEISKFIVSCNPSKNSNQLSNIKSIYAKFSYFTYFQFIQNDLQKIFINDFLKEKNDINELSNLIFNFTKLIQDTISEKKLIFKIIPNFIKYVSQGVKYIMAKIEKLNETNEEFKKSFDYFTEYFKNTFFNDLNSIFKTQYVFECDDILGCLQDFQKGLIEIILKTKDGKQI